jgi:hypothetical protein
LTLTQLNCWYSFQSAKVLKPKETMAGLFANSKTICSTYSFLRIGLIDNKYIGGFDLGLRFSPMGHGIDIKWQFIKETASIPAIAFDFGMAHYSIDNSFDSGQSIALTEYLFSLIIQKSINKYLKIIVGSQYIINNFLDMSYFDKTIYFARTDNILPFIGLEYDYKNSSFYFATFYRFIIKDNEFAQHKGYIPALSENILRKDNLALVFGFSYKFSTKENK